MSPFLATGIASGFFLHQIFKRVELDTYPLSIAGAFMILTIILAVMDPYISTQHETIASSASVACLTTLFSILSLWINMLIHRAFFHPLNNFPGPFVAKLSKFWALGKVVESGVKWHQVAGKLQKQYGDFVRVGKELLFKYN
jgi:hypothetical protein